MRTSSCVVLGEEVGKTVYHHYSATAVVFVVDPRPKFKASNAPSMYMV